MGIAEPGRMSADAFLDWLARQSERHELVDGFPVRLMAGAKQSHNVVTTNLVVVLAPSAKASGCRTTSSDTAVRTGSHSIRFPDVVVDCGPPDPSAREAANPTVVVEVASPGTSVVDLTDKLDEYRRHAAIRVIVLVEPDIVSVKVYRRIDAERWAVERYDTLDATIPVPEIDTAIAVADVYDTLEPAPAPRLRLVGGSQPGG
ncbi:Uma2 family endonuclease [Salinarimonas ramus]|uniref:Putative restriction endonuclease domain-containing protein n=1 Tax=Salinarimonas ramus TaxID=690164 RepID=A0A917V7X6_9HYPH|nr:Uma2 family endonuclease [Salinarimonas ramus]GGK47985.1 hypothetical protein GCM10011322_38700 [Salinarimonas ramus]